MSNLDLATVITAGNQLFADGYSVALYIFPTLSNPFRLTISKATGGTNLHVEGTGKTIEEALENALANFPSNPLSGAKWNPANQPRQLSKPEDASFDEVVEH